MKEYNKDLDIVFSPMSDETMSWLDELFSTCKRFGGIITTLPKKTVSLWKLLLERTMV